MFDGPGSVNSLKAWSTTSSQVELPGLALTEGPVRCSVYETRAAI